jgi:hypothetical protein
LRKSGQEGSLTNNSVNLQFSEKDQELQQLKEKMDLVIKEADLQCNHFQTEIIQLQKKLNEKDSKIQKLEQHILLEVKTESVKQTNDEEQLKKLLTEKDLKIQKLEERLLQFSKIAKINQQRETRSSTLQQLYEEKTLKLQQEMEARQNNLQIQHEAKILQLQRQLEDHRKVQELEEMSNQNGSFSTDSRTKLTKSISLSSLRLTDSPTSLTPMKRSPFHSPILNNYG